MPLCEKSAIKILQQMIIDFYKAIYRLLKSGLFNPLGARKEECPRSRKRILISTSPQSEFTDFWVGFFFFPLFFPLFFLFLPPGYFLLLMMLQCSSTELTLLFPPTWDKSFFFPWPVLKVYLLSDIHPLLAAGGLDAQQSRLHVRKSAAAHISHWSLVEDHSGPLPTAPCYGKRKAIKP